MNIKEVETSVPALIKTNIVPFLWGSQGIGKTQVVKQIAKKMGFDSVVHLMLASQEVGDLIGVLIEKPDGTCAHSRPDWFPKEGKHLIFLDELNRATPEVIQSMFSFILDGKIHQHQLPEGCAIAAAGNYQNNNFITTEMTGEQAFMSRFAHIDFKPSVEEFVVFAEKSGNENIAEFISNQPDMLMAKNKDNKFDFSQITPDPRTWNDFIGKLDQDPTLDNVRYELYSGLVGSAAAAAYMSFLKNKQERLSGKKVLNDYKSVKKQVLGTTKNKEMRLDILNSAVEEIFLLLDGTDVSDQQMENFKEFLLDIPAEMLLKSVKKLHTINMYRKNEILNNKNFTNACLPKLSGKGGAK